MLLLSRIFACFSLKKGKNMSKTNIISISSTEEPFYIKFYPAIKSQIGCERATLILGRLEYWFTNSKYVNGFYKFIEPCEHPLYREGDSWSEEVGFPRKIFAKAFDLIGVRYKSKSAFRRAKDRFQGKLYASYHDRKTNQTYFIRNHEFASQFIKGLFNRKFPSAPSKPKKEKTQEQPCPVKDSFNASGRSWNDQIGRSSYKPIQINTSSLGKDQSISLHTQPEPLQRKETEEMIKIWKEEIGELGVSSLSNGLLRRLHDSLKNFFGQSLDSWKGYCSMISSSKFLMGEAQNKFFKKAWITWAIKGENIERIKGGDFKLGDRATNQDKKTQEINHKIKNLENKKIETRETINNIQDSLYSERIKKVKEEVKNLSEEDTKNFKEEFLKFLDGENNSMTEEFRNYGWKGTFIESYFASFLEETIASQLFICPLQEEADQIIKASGFLSLLESICEEIHLLEQQRISLEQEYTVKADLDIN